LKHTKDLRAIAFYRAGSDSADRKQLFISFGTFRHNVLKHPVARKVVLD